MNKQYKCNGPLCHGKMHPSDKMMGKDKRMCKECNNKKSKDYLQKNGLPYRNLKNKYKHENGCVECGCVDVRLLEFDHNQKKKNLNISQCNSKRKIEKEIKHTQILCIWCHRIKTYQNQNGETFSRKTTSSVIKSPSSKSCLGDLCKGDYKNNSEFYHRNGKPKGQCKNCMAYGSWKKRRLKAMWVLNKKLLERKKCKSCYRPVTQNNFMCFDFDHLNPSKKTYTISRLINKGGGSVREINEEMNKCDLLCCYCHKIKTTIQLDYRYSYKNKDGDVIHFPIRTCNRCHNDTGNVSIKTCPNCISYFGLITSNCYDRSRRDNNDTSLYKRFSYSSKEVPNREELLKNKETRRSELALHCLEQKNIKEDTIRRLTFKK